jgi:serine/threonine protein kinase
MPTATDYSQAIQNLRVTAGDEELKAGEPLADAMGLPLQYTGNFAVVFQVRCPQTQRTWAVKCFTKEVDRRGERYEAISQHLRRVQLPFMVGFEYQERGILVGGGWHPIVKMDWVEGETLNRFVAENLDKPGTLRQLLGLWRKLAERLRAAEVTHADLQHGNVLLVPARDREGHRLMLVDYDGMYVPALARQPSGELGHPSYQHPERLRQEVYSAEVDRFSHLAIYCAIRCLIAGGRRLWERFDNGDNLLFRESDFAKPRESEMLHRLWAARDEELRALVGHLILATQTPLDQVPWVPELVSDGQVRPLEPSVQQRVTRLMGNRHPTRATLSAKAPSGTQLTGPAAPPYLKTRIIEILRTHGSENKLHVSPHVPAHKASNAAKSCALRPDDTILGLIDCTAFGSASDALVFGEHGFYYHNKLGNSPDPGFVAYREFPGISFGRPSADCITLGGDRYCNNAGSSIRRGTIIEILDSVRRAVIECGDAVGVEPEVPVDRHALAPPDEGARRPSGIDPAPGTRPMETDPAEEAAAAARSASSLGIALPGEATKQFANEADANQAKDEWKTQLPQQPSAYVPSGELPVPALMMIIGGAVLGVPAGTFAALVVLLIGGVISALLAALFGVLPFCFLWCLPLVALVICAIVTGGFQCAVAGVASAAVITEMGKVGKNRNTLLPILLSLVSGGLAVLLSMVVLRAVMSQTCLDWGVHNRAVFWSLILVRNPAVFWSLTFVGIAIGMVCAGINAYMFVCEAKFCERCELYMESVKLYSIARGGLRVLVEALKQGNVPVMVGVYHSARGDDGTSALFACPKCGCGFLDLSAAFKVTYKGEGGTDRKVEETWMVGSGELTADAVKRLQRFAEEGGSVRPAVRGKGSGPPRPTAKLPMPDTAPIADSLQGRRESYPGLIACAHCGKKHAPQSRCPFCGRASAPARERGQRRSDERRSDVGNRSSTPRNKPSMSTRPKNVTSRQIGDRHAVVKGECPHCSEKVTFARTNATFWATCPACGGQVWVD